MSAPEGYFQVIHGKLTVNVPRNIFTGTDCIPDGEKSERFGKTLRTRYPWLTPGSVEVLLRSARTELLRIKDEETGGRNESTNLANKGNIEGAIRHLKAHLETDPEDADSWYALGTLLCKAGRTGEGYEAFNRGRKNFG